MKVFSAALALLASSAAVVSAVESTKLRAQQDDTTARDLAAGGSPGSPNADVPPFDQLDGMYIGVSTASILGRTLFGGCSKNLADCPNDGGSSQGGYYEKNFMTGVVNCDKRCKQNTCSGAVINFHTHNINGLEADVDVTVTGGTSKNNDACTNGGGGITIPYHCMAIVRVEGSVGFTCDSRAVTPGPVQMGTIPEGVLTVKARLSPGGNLNWNAFAMNPDSDPDQDGFEFAPSAGELSAKAAMLNTGSIKGIKMGSADWGDAMPVDWVCGPAR